jgi:hypothetical protein
VSRVMRPLYAVFAGSVLLAAGFAAGWLAAGPRTPEAGLTSRIVPQSRISMEAGGKTPSDKTETPDKKTHISAITTEGLSAMIASLSKLDPQTYAETMLAMDNSPDTGERYLHNIARDMGATPAQAEAYIRLFRERRGLGPEENVQNLRTFLTFVGGRGGMDTLKVFLKTYPDGFNGLDSLVHGVALAHPQETVEWYNQLPDDSKLRNRALIGMMWGLAHTGTSAALKVFTDLEASDQAVSIKPLADSYSMGKGFDGADELLSTVPASFRDAALATMLPHLNSLPPEGFVNWSAKYCEQNPQVLSSFRTAAAVFARQSPDAAAAWAEQNATAASTSTASGIMIASLVASRPDLVRRWLNANASHPAADALRGSLPP